ncbi:MAG: glycosyltransferase family 4 protein [Mesorhizobium sp.]
MSQVVLYDASHLVARLGCQSPDGFMNVDLAYAAHFSTQPRSRFVYSRSDNPSVIARPLADEIMDRTRRSHWRVGSRRDQAVFAALRTAILAKGVSSGRVQASAVRSTTTELLAEKITRPLWKSGLQLKLLGGGGALIPDGGIYLNIAQHAVAPAGGIGWLRSRPDLRSVFFIHDLLPLDCPEFFPPCTLHDFNGRVEMALSQGRALIFASDAVRQRVEEEFRDRRRPPLPSMVAHLPSPLSEVDATKLDDPELSAAPYFVIVGTIEPRKNHLLLLSIWRQMAHAARRTGAEVPKLVVVGRRGHRVQQVCDVLDLSSEVRPHVVEISGLSAESLARLIANSRGLLMPSFAEGYGLPLVEAMSLGVPVVATDAPVFREVTQGRATYHAPHDGEGWRQTILSLADRKSPFALEKRAEAGRFARPTWARYFDDVGHFLKGV